MSLSTPTQEHTAREHIHPFLTSNFTINDYIKQYTSYTTILEHITALSKCIAACAHDKQYVYKLYDVINDRMCYKKGDRSTLTSDYNTIINELYDIHHSQSSIDNIELPSQIINEMIEAEEYPDTITDSDTDRCSHSITSSLSNNYKHKLKKCSLFDFLRLMRKQHKLLYISELVPFTDKMFDYDEQGNIIKRNIQEVQLIDVSKAASIIEHITGIKDPRENHIIKISPSNRIKLATFVPPSKVNAYNPILIKQWLAFMLSRIKPLYHNAFTDFIYSIRYRLTTGECTPAKAYVLFGKHGQESKSFLIDCLSTVFGSYCVSLTKDQFTQDQFNEWQKSMGLICIEECETDHDKNILLSNVIKSHTSGKVVSRGMGTMTKVCTNYAVLAMTSNDYTLNGLIYSDEACLSRLVVINFKKSTYDSDEWCDIESYFLKDPDFAYSLWRYIVSDDGFIKQEGSGYEYTPERYTGSEKQIYIEKAKNKSIGLADVFIKTLRYKEDPYNEISKMVALNDNDIETLVNNKEFSDELLTTKYNIIEHVSADNTSYIDMYFLKKSLEMFIQTVPSCYRLSYRDVEQALYRNGWLYACPIQLPHMSTRVIGFCKVIDESDWLFYNDKNKSSTSADMINDEKKEAINKVFEEIESKLEQTKRFKYIAVKTVNMILAKYKGIVTKSDIENELYDRWFHGAPCNITVNNKTVYVYKKADKELCERLSREP